MLICAIMCKVRYPPTPQHAENTMLSLKGISQHTLPGVRTRWHYYSVTFINIIHSSAYKTIALHRYHLTTNRHNSQHALLLPWVARDLSIAISYRCCLSSCTCYQPKKRSMALFTSPELRFGAVGLGTTSVGCWAFLYAMWVNERTRLREYLKG